MFTRKKKVMTDERKDCKFVSKLREGRDLTRITYNYCTGANPNPWQLG